VRVVLAAPLAAAEGLVPALAAAEPLAAALAAIDGEAGADEGTAACPLEPPQDANIRPMRLPTMGVTKPRLLPAKSIASQP